MYSPQSLGGERKKIENSLSSFIQCQLFTNIEEFNMSLTYRGRNKIKNFFLYSLTKSDVDYREPDFCVG